MRQIRPKPTGNSELYSWFFMRVSGALLVILALGHLYVMHLSTGVEKIDYHWVMRRYQTPFWRAWDMTMLALALLHGMNGLRIVISDYIHARGWRVISFALLYLAVVVFFVIGVFPILTLGPGFGVLEVMRHAP